MRKMITIDNIFMLNMFSNITLTNADKRSAIQKYIYVLFTNTPKTLALIIQGFVDQFILGLITNVGG